MAEYIPPKNNIWIIAIVAALAAFMEVLDTSIASVALPYISGGLGASVDEANWVLTSYLVANAIVLPAGGWASSVLGRKKFFLLCILLFTVSSFLCGIAPSLPLLLLFRVFQGIGGGGLVPVAQAITSDTFPPSKQALAFAFFGVVVVLAPSVGPTLGGWITDHYSWRWIFLINVPVGALAMVLNYYLLEEREVDKGHRSNLRKIDGIGFALLTLAMGTLQIALDKGEERDWFGSPFIVTFLVIALAALAALFWWEWRNPHPLIKIRLFKYKNFAVSCFLMLMLGAVLNAGTTLMPLLQQGFFGYTASLAGLSVTLAGVSQIFLFAFAGNLTRVFQLRYLAGFGFLAMVIAYYLTATHLTPQDNFRTFEWLRVGQTFGLGFLFTGIITAGYMGVPQEDNNQIAGITALMRNIGGSIAISLTNALVTERAQAHQLRLSGSLTHASAALKQTLPHSVAYFTHAGFNHVTANRLSFGFIGRVMARQTHVQAYADAYFSLAVLCGIALLAVPLLDRNTPGVGGAKGGH